MLTFCFFLNCFPCYGYYSILYIINDKLYHICHTCNPGNTEFAHTWFLFNGCCSIIYTKIGPTGKELIWIDSEVLQYHHFMKAVHCHYFTWKAISNKFYVISSKMIQFLAFTAGTCRGSAAYLKMAKDIPFNTYVSYI